MEASTAPPPETNPRPTEREIASLDQVRAARTVVAVAPSGLVFRLRPMNLERHALAGGLPDTLRAVAQGGSQAVDKILATKGDSPEEQETKAEVLKYLDDAVREMVAEPVLGPDFDMDDLPPTDYRWLLLIAMGEEDYDGEGRRLWGREPLSRFRIFREQHSCPDDCDGCQGVQAVFSAGIR